MAGAKPTSRQSCEYFTRCSEVVKALEIPAVMCEFHRPPCGPLFHLLATRIDARVTEQGRRTATAVTASIAARHRTSSHGAIHHVTTSFPSAGKQTVTYLFPPRPTRVCRARFGLQVAPNFIAQNVLEKWNVAYHGMSGSENAKKVQYLPSLFVWTEHKHQETRASNRTEGFRSSRRPPFRHYSRVRKCTLERHKKKSLLSVHQFQASNCTSCFVPTVRHTLARGSRYVRTRLEIPDRFWYLFF